jgi:hypothetical protein
MDTVDKIRLAKQALGQTSSIKSIKTDGSLIERLDKTVLVDNKELLFS